MRILEFFDLLIHPRGHLAGQPFQLLPWQREWLEKLFGTLQPNGLRTYRSSFCYVAKGNGKSSFAAAIGLYMLLADDEPSANIAIAAGSRQQASIIFDECLRLVKSCPRLRDVVHAIPSQRKLTYPKKDGCLQALAAETVKGSLHGLDLSCLINDEFAFNNNRELHDTLVWATSKDRKQPLTLYLTTAGFRKDTPCYETLCYARNVRDGVIKDETFLPWLYEPEEGDSIELESTWKKANPSLGTLIDTKQFKRDFETAKTSQASLAAFKRLRLNIWTASQSGFVDLDAWDFCKAPFPFFPKDTRIYLGCDLSATTDLTGLAGIVPWDGKYYLFHWSWCSEEGAKKRVKQNLLKYDTFQEEGSLTIVPGNTIEQGLIREKIQTIAKTFHVESITFDKWSAVYLAEVLQKDAFNVFSFPQSHSYYNAPTKRLEGFILDGKLIHDGASILKWQIANLTLDIDSNGMVRPSKSKSADKIDLCCAIIMAVGACCQDESRGAIQESIYESKGISWL